MKYDFEMKRIPHWLMPSAKCPALITSNKSIREWPDMLAGDEVLATALLDRLLHHCNEASIDGRSFRLRNIEQRIPAKE